MQEVEVSCSESMELDVIVEDLGQRDWKRGGGEIERIRERERRDRGKSDERRERFYARRGKL